MSHTWLPAERNTQVATAMLPLTAHRHTHSSHPSPVTRHTHSSHPSTITRHTHSSPSHSHSPSLPRPLHSTLRSSAPQPNTHHSHTHTPQRHSSSTKATSLSPAALSFIGVSTPKNATATTSLGRRLTSKTTSLSGPDAFHCAQPSPITQKGDRVLKRATTAPLQRPIPGRRFSHPRSVFAGK